MAPAAKRRYNSREDLVHNANKSYPGLITYTLVAGVEHWQCNYCFAHRKKPHMFLFGKGNPIVIHCTKSNAHADKDAVGKWCDKSAKHFVPTVTKDSVDLRQKSLHAFLQPSVVPPQSQSRTVFQTFEHRMGKVVANPRQASASDRANLGRVLCHGFTESTIEITRDYRKRTLQVDPLRQDDSDGPRDRSFYVDKRHQFRRADGSLVVGTFFSKQCLGTLCTACKYLHTVRSFQDYVYANYMLEEHGSKRGERRAGAGFQYCRLNRNEITAGIIEDRKKRALARLKLWCKMTDLHVSRDNLSRKLARVQSLPMLSQLFNTAIEDGKLQTDSVLMNFLVNLAQNLNRTKITAEGIVRRQGHRYSGACRYVFQVLRTFGGRRTLEFLHANGLAPTSNTVDVCLKS